MIFTERTIKVNNDISTISNPIILYRGDYNVEVRFTILNCPYKYSENNSTNVIETVDAYYCQLVIKVPNDRPPIFSDIVETKEGCVIFTFSGEMIDESIEVGDYTFQIRLFDANQKSRATIPPVENGIKIREPIAFDDVTTTNEVGKATVGYATTTAGTPEDAFDSEGNYNKTTWGPGDRITAAKLDKMEAGIDGVNKKIANNSSQIKDIEKKKADKSTTNNIQQQVNNLVLGAVGDGNNAEVVQARGRYDTLNARIESSESRLNDIVTFSDAHIMNIFDSSNSDNVSNKAINPDGTLIDFTNRGVTCLVELKANTSYSINCTNSISSYALYNMDGTFILKNGDWHVQSEPFTITHDTKCKLRLEIMNLDIKQYILNICETEFYDGAFHEYNETKTPEKQVHLKLSELENDSNFVSNKLYSLKWYALGDSLTEQGHYTSAVVRKTGMILTNYGIGGTRLAYGEDDSKKEQAMCKRWNEMSAEQPDIITVMGGTNDCYYSTLGTPGDKDITTVAGAVYTIIKGLQEKYPKAVLVFSNMPMRWDNSFEEYANIVFETCKYWHIPCVDMFHNCGFNEWNRSVFNLDNDGIHVNDLGGERMASQLIAEIEKAYLG